MAGGVQAPEKELRFTRSGQAVVFWLTSAMLLVAALMIGVTGIYRDVNPALPHPAWACLPLVLFLLTGRLALRLTRHAYLILTPLGIEIFPFYRPDRGMSLVTWQEIVLTEVNEVGTLLTLHFNAERTSGVHLSLKPIRADRREFLLKALAGRAELLDPRVEDSNPAQ
jgi:hypothetical protein